MAKPKPRYFISEAKNVVALTAMREMHQESDGWRIITTVQPRKGKPVYGRVMEEHNGYIRPARFTSEAAAKAAIPLVARI